MCQNRILYKGCGKHKPNLNDQGIAGGASCTEAETGGGAIDGGGGWCSPVSDGALGVAHVRVGVSRGVSRGGSVDPYSGRRSGVNKGGNNAWFVSNGGGGAADVGRLLERGPARPVLEGGERSDADDATVMAVTDLLRRDFGTVPAVDNPLEATIAAVPVSFEESAPVADRRGTSVGGGDNYPGADFRLLRHPAVTLEGALEDAEDARAPRDDPLALRSSPPPTVGGETLETSTRWEGSRALAVYIAPPSVYARNGPARVESGGVPDGVEAGEAHVGDALAQDDAVLSEEADAARARPLPSRHTPVPAIGFEAREIAVSTQAWGTRGSKIYIALGGAFANDHPGHIDVGRAVDIVQGRGAPVPYSVAVVAEASVGAARGGVLRGEVLGAVMGDVVEVWGNAGPIQPGIDVEPMVACLSPLVSAVMIDAVGEGTEYVVGEVEDEEEVVRGGGALFEDDNYEGRQELNAAVPAVANTRRVRELRASFLRLCRRENRRRVVSGGNPSGNAQGSAGVIMDGLGRVWWKVWLVSLTVLAMVSGVIVQWPTTPMYV